ncbi:MAG: VWA domain-containing protein [Candidatus Binatia bacterium]
MTSITRQARGTGATLLALFAVAWAGPAQAGRGWIEDPTGRTSMQVAFRQQPSYEDLAEAQAALTRTAALLCDATEGQIRITQIRLVSSPASEDLAALWLHDAEAASGGAYDSTGADFRRLGAHMDVFASARLRPDRLAHLLGHHMFGLGDQYDNQRRRGSVCGIGPGFDRGHLDESNHSIMQGAGRMQCVDGPLLGQDCLRDDECSGAACKAVLASEWSVPGNHDLLRGDGGACPRASPVSRVRLSGILPSRAEIVRAFDGKDFLSARATSAWHQRVEVLGAAGTLPGIRLHFYLTHTARLSWQLSVGADAEQFGGRRGEFMLLRSWLLLFNEDFSLAATHPENLSFQLPASSTKGPLEIAIDIGSRNPDAARNPGEGYDGLQMVTAGTPTLRLAVDGIVGCSADWCATSWNESTGRWELSEQSLLHGGASDWQTLTANLPFVVSPQGVVAEEPPALCEAPPQFITEVMGADQVVLVLDTSRSMGMRVDGQGGEVCGNAVDDDLDGDTDEADCAESRLEYQRVAARAFLALAGPRNLQVGMVAMHTDAELVSDVAEVSPPRRAVLGAVLGSLAAEGDTALGTGLERAQEALKKVERVARHRAIILLTDGARNVGIAPGHGNLLDPLLYRVFTVAVGRAADGLTLAALAARSGGVAYEAPEATGMPAILAELASRHDGSAPILPRTPFDLARAGEETTTSTKPVSSSRDFEITVEEKASELVLFLGTRNDRIDDWRLLFELQAPDGERIDDTSPQSRAERGFVAVKVTDPKPGRWRLRVLPGGRGMHKSEVLAYTLQPDADLFVDADPRIASASRRVRISARPSYVADIDGDVSIQGTVRRPDGSQMPVALTRDAITRSWGADFDQFAGRGLYEIRLRMVVGHASQPALGEPIFPGPSRVLMRVVPFERTATASFFVADGPPPPCSSADCDEDGLPDRLEAGCPEDVDGDGMWNRFDADADNDEIFDGEEGIADLDLDGIADFCDPETTPDSLTSAIEAEEAAVAAACDADGATSRERLRASLSAVRRIIQELRTRDGVPTDVRADIVQKLDKVIGLKKQAVVISDVLPEFCRKFQARLGEALTIEREMRVRVDPYLSRTLP